MAFMLLCGAACKAGRQAEQKGRPVRPRASVCEDAAPSPGWIPPVQQGPTFQIGAKQMSRQAPALDERPVTQDPDQTETQEAMVATAAMDEPPATQELEEANGS